MTATCTPGLPSVVRGLVRGSSLPTLGPERIWITPWPAGAPWAWGAAPWAWGAAPWGAAGCAAAGAAGAGLGATGGLVSIPGGTAGAAAGAAAAGISAVALTACMLVWVSVGLRSTFG